MIRRRDLLAGLVVAAPFAATAKASENALPPMGWTQFRINNRPKMQMLEEVNCIVNSRIIPHDAVARLPWRIIEGDAIKKHGCCHDYCVTKRAMLLGRDWPNDKLSFRVVRYSAEEDHMVLIANLDGQELVLDNLRTDIVTWTQSGYQIKEAQDIEHHDHWIKSVLRTMLDFYAWPEAKVLDVTANERRMWKGIEWLLQTKMTFPTTLMRRLGCRRKMSGFARL